MVVADNPVLPVGHAHGWFELSVGLRAGLYTLSYINHATGAIYRWLRDLLWTGDTTKERTQASDDEAADIPIGSEGLSIFPYFSGKGSPMPDPSARGIFYGLSLKHGKAHLLRAYYEGIAFWLKECIEDLNSRGIFPDKFCLGGGLSRSKVLPRIIADVIGCSIILVNAEEASIGAAMLAGEGIGILGGAIGNPDQFLFDKVPYEPNSDKSDDYQIVYMHYRKIKQRLYP